ncbi:hypothetical protein GLW08_01500 [Pontibacillus yanchengensis]|uniref:Uncharacterized protein n=2 Tax=Pontibacillus yanchengensis TaxID=462910 RepID=A0ACC7VBR6_9BACI|nr:flagellar hook-length control protein FliK [Pontibacillus yanchengensis]MYL33145.1 hypothetical protein [Pontibacillus yanchengensis]MYL52005.1 hypothetical protein [Pontibacillus yanchengensis]
MSNNVMMLSQVLSQSKHSLKQVMNQSAQSGSRKSFRNAMQSVLQNTTSKSELQKGLNELVSSSQFSEQMKSLLTHVKQFFQSIPKEELTLNSDMLTNLKNSDLWSKLSNQKQKNIEDLFENNQSILSILNLDTLDSNDSSIQLMTVQTWFQANPGYRSTELGSAIESQLKQLQRQSITLNTQFATSFIADSGLQQNNVTFNKQGEEAKAMEKLVLQLTTSLQNLDQETQLTKSQMATLEKKLFEIAKQWVQMDKSQSQAPNQILQQLKQEGVSDKALESWQQALSNLKKRSSLANQNQYGQNATVTRNEFANWIRSAWQRMNTEGSKAANQEQQNLKTSPSQFSTSDMVPMSKQEQMVIKLNGSQSNESMQKQLVEEFQKVMNRSKFSIHKGSSQLSIKLNPGQLGDMMVKMTQQNGEMMVKIMVTSQAAKEMLEGNLQQLRHMFSPSQVQVEKHDQLTSSQESHLLDKDQADKDEEQTQNFHSTYEADEEYEEDSENVSFHDLLMNEKV